MNYEVNPESGKLDLPVSLIEKMQYRGMLCLPGITTPTSFLCRDYDDTERGSGVRLQDVLIDTSSLTTHSRTQYAFMELHHCQIVFFPVDGKEAKGDQTDDREQDVCSTG
jgi:hypothetical protein